MTTNSNGAAKPPVDFDQEVRFAVVMYGGSSLAIYINGVAQEILRLVRSTAPEFGSTQAVGQAHLADEDLRGSERIYRLIGRMLSRQGVDVGDVVKPTPDSLKDSPIRTRFVVDILTGTSAGGINSVYLAKALANNQNMDELKNLWIKEGDIGTLLNDQESYNQLKFTLEDDTGEPWSLLNSRRMYLKLLEALRGMEQTPACPLGQSPLVDELDLFVTSTDMAGRILQLRLADDVVREYRHRNVFRFRYRSLHASDIEQNDLGAEYNAFLAFAARSTSAHQAAFSPVNLGDATRIISPVNPDGTPNIEKGYSLAGEHPANDKALRIFYRDYLLDPAQEEQLANVFSDIWFVDGGTLDNKPFSFVVDELPLRHADSFVDRKLLYIEPAPEHLERMRAQKERPRIVQNVSAGLSSLPRYESIVEDLTRLLERNRLIERIDHIMRGMEQDLMGMSRKPRTRDKLLHLLRDRDEMLKWMRSKGTAWGSYQRLRVAEVTDDLTLLVARAAGFSEESDEFLAIRYLVRHWRDSNYDSHMNDGKRSQVEFLVEFDLMWVIRRIQFVLKKLTDLAGPKPEAQRIARVSRNQQESEVWPVEDNDVREFRQAIRDLRRELNSALVNLRGERRKLWARDDTNPFRSLISSLEISSEDLLELLREPTDKDRRGKAEAMLNTPLKSPPENAPAMRTRSDAVEALTENVRLKLKKVIDTARHRCSEALRPPDDRAATAFPSDWNLFLRETLWYYYVNFEEFDQVSHPLLYASGVGEETDIIDIFRISPADARSIIDESAPVNEAGEKAREGEEGKRVNKLAGTTLGNFGAFFEEKFRVNDILWGRLDGAERIISVLLQSNPELRDHVIQQAHRAILVEERLSDDKEASRNTVVQRTVWEALDAWDNSERRLELLQQAASALPDNSTFRTYLETLAQGDDPLKLFKEMFIKNYDAFRQFTEDATVQTATRANRVLGDMALGYFPSDGKESRKRKVAMWIGRRLRIFIEAAIEPEGPVRRKQKLRLAACYLLSLLIFFGVCYPVIVLLLSSKKLLPSLGYLAILIVTLLLALIPLGLTSGYNYVWLKFRGKLTSLLPR
jgi:patatin-related protein